MMIPISNTERDTAIGAALAQLRSLLAAHDLTSHYKSARPAAAQALTLPQPITEVDHAALGLFLEELNAQHPGLAIRYAPRSR